VVGVGLAGLLGLCGAVEGGGTEGDAGGSANTGVDGVKVEISAMVPLGSLLHR